VHKLTEFVLLICRKIIKIVATRCQILRLKCTKIHFGWDSAPDPTEAAYSSQLTQTLQLGIKGVVLVRKEDRRGTRSRM